MGNNGTIVKTRTPFLSRYGQPWTQQTSENSHFSPTHCFYIVLGICRRFPTSGPIPNGKKCLFLGPRSYSKGPDHAFQKVLTSPAILMPMLHDLHSTLGKRTGFPFSPLVQCFHVSEMSLTFRRLLMDCNHEIVHISHSQTLNSTCDRGHYPETRLQWSVFAISTCSYRSPHVPTKLSERRSNRTQQTSENGHFPRRIVFTWFLGFADVFPT